MLILDKPYVSDLLKETIAKNNFEVLENSFLDELSLPKGIKTVSRERAVIEINAQQFPKIYSNSENAINWISENLNKTNLPEKINLFKDKVKFRDLVKDMFPNFFYREVAFDQLDAVDIDSLPVPFIIKPSVGFFSMGVYKVQSREAWKTIPQRIRDEMAATAHLYPEQVLNSSKFIIEQLIDGDEFAFDVYFDECGKAVVLGIFKHLFSSDSDVSDRVYYTSKAIIEEHLKHFTTFIQMVGDRAVLKNFPMHVEVRVNNKNEIVPIEVNPMRFGGWCTTADLTTMAFNLNPYEYYFGGKTPQWDKILDGKDQLHYCLVILDNTTGFDSQKIAAFNYDAVLKHFNKPLTLRKTNWNQYPVFGMLFTETHADNYREIEQILKSDLREFVTLT